MRQLHPDKDVSKAIETAKKTTYINSDYVYLKNVSITEWDIKSAGLSVLKFKNCLPQDELDRLSELDKHTRTIQEGLLQKNHKELSEIIINTLSQVRQYFVAVNSIKDDQILSIKKDAIFLVNKTPDKVLIKEYFNFRKKNTYTSYINFEKKEFYYDSYRDILDTKGLSKEAVEKQSDYLLKDIKKFLRSAERLDASNMFVLLSNYRLKYLNKELPLETYRELTTGKFRLGKYLAENVSDDMINDIDISQNYMNFILPMIQVMI